MNLGVIVSGNLGFISLNYLFNIYNVCYVLTDSQSEDIIDYCIKNQIDYFVGNPRNGKALNFCIKQKKIDILVSVNYLFLIEKDIIELPKFFAFNIHGSLLPKYRGRTPHVWAIINNESKTGITAHIIDEKCDAGDIIEQIEIEIDPQDTGSDLLEKFKLNYVKLLSSVLSKAKSNKIKLTKQQNNLATYFSKRTPNDGHINWNWHKERINNWIRAQAYPYPGAFSFLNGSKIIIDKIKFSDVGFSDKMTNGFLISSNPILVKTPNGVVELFDVREFDYEIKKGEILK